MSKKVTMLMILDGFGINEKVEGNTVKLANIPHLNEIFTKNPNTIIHTSGLEVGLPEGQMGNSEVGHTNIGAGRIVYQDLAKITKSIEDGDFFSVPELCAAIENCKKNNSKLHIMGLLSDGGVHSHIDHLKALIEICKEHNIVMSCCHKKIFNKIILNRLHALDSFTTTILSLKVINCHSLDITKFCHSEDYIFSWNHIFHGNIIFIKSNLGLSFISKFIFNF